MELVLGQIYEQSCAIVKTFDGKEYAIPVFAHLHADPQFGFPHEHYHIDGRFYMEPRMYHQYHLQHGFTNAVIKREGQEPKFLRIEVRQVRCIRKETGLSFPTNPTDRQRDNLENYDRWYETYIEKSCQGKRCPHYGTEMLEKNGLLVCPMHHLTADVQTLKIIPHGRKMEIL